MHTYVGPTQQVRLAPRLPLYLHRVSVVFNQAKSGFQHSDHQFWNYQHSRLEFVFFVFLGVHLGTCHSLVTSFTQLAKQPHKHKLNK